ncbi:hypothetical protein COCCADRAFT_22425 [Bipolaris zeicola 26-R-13]|uniref:Macro domain-containing protein n=1 Tax=Cochliobolus carbonum (strain 26-R-13) TaxID=930089 RepID=W6YRL6_COCC2|nr:uncharacterized protein COCCADRAFT_22425 [Bipolaris zeicola 26-R-13]EUC38074.1 hypothetical protein COCCADRAFT_22425 [Bipolaris zeicola 26-R-13]
MSSLRLATASNVRAFQNLTTALKTSDRKWTHAIDEEALEDEIGRFRVWAGNLGALQKGHSSLDYRLRDSPVSNTNTLKLLRELETNVNEAYAVASEARLPYEEQARPDMIEDDDDDGFFSAEEDDDDSSSDEPRTELKMRFGEIVDIIDNLYKLSVRIRTPGLRSRSLKASSYTQKDPETGIDIFDMYAAQDLKHVQELVSHLRQSYVANETQEDQDFLIKRLSASVTLRRRQFKYWKRHRDKLSASTISEDVQGLNVTTPFERPATASDESPKSHPVPIVAVLKEAPSQKTGKTMLSGTEVTQLHQSLDDIVDNKSVTSYAITVKDVHGKGIDLPPPPKSADGDKEFECPYCWIVCPARYGKGKAWRTHLLQDLQPYICTYQDCESSHQLFRSRREWAEHEASHRKVWRCPEHPNAVFHSQLGLEDHLRQTHLDSFPESQLVTIAKVGEATTVDLRERCPICRAPTDAKEIGDLQSHIANHLERIATFALPHSMEDDSDGASGIPSPGSTTSKSLWSSISANMSKGKEKSKENAPTTLHFDPSKSVHEVDPSHDLLSAENLQQLPDANKNILDVISNQMNNPKSSYHLAVAHGSEKLPVLQTKDIPTLRSLYRSRQLLQLDQSYSPDDSYNRMISFCNYDLTRMEVDAIVNNVTVDLKYSPPRGSLHYAIMEAGGPNLVQEARSKPQIKFGQVEVTHGHNLPSVWVLHAAVPTSFGGDGMAQLSNLADCYRNSLKAAADLQIRTVAFPCLGTRGCGFGPRQAARIALQAVREDLDARSESRFERIIFERIIFCAKSAVDEQAYKDFFPVYFPPTHGDLEVARNSVVAGSSDQSTDNAVMVAQVINTQAQLRKSTAALRRDFSQILPEIEIGYLDLLDEIDITLTSIHNELLGPRTLNKHSTDIALICSVLFTLCSSILGMTETAKEVQDTVSNYQEILKITDWGMNGKYGSNLKEFLLDCCSFTTILDSVMAQEQNDLDLVRMRPELEGYRAKARIQDTGDAPNQPENLESVEPSTPTASSNRDSVKLHQISSVTKLYQLAIIHPKKTMAQPSADFNNIVCLAREDMTKLEVDVIVNSTDTSFLGMGILDRLIFKKGGPELQEEVQQFGVCKEGDVKTTSGYLLPAKNILHVIPPEAYRKDNKNVLRNIYRGILHTATYLKAKSVAIPCIGTGALGFPRRDCASLAMEEVRRFLQSKEPGGLEKIIFVVYSDIDEAIYKNILPTYFPPVEETGSKQSGTQSLGLARNPSSGSTVAKDDSQSIALKEKSRHAPLGEATVVAEVKVTFTEFTTSKPRLIHNSCVVLVSGSSVHIDRKTNRNNKRKPSRKTNDLDMDSQKSTYEYSFDLIPATDLRHDQSEVIVNDIRKRDTPPGRSFMLFFKCKNDTDAATLAAALEQAARQAREQDAHGYYVPSAETMPDATLSNQDDQDDENYVYDDTYGDYGDYIGNEDAIDDDDYFSTRILEYLTEDLHSRPTSYIGQNITDIAATLRLDVDLVRKYLARLAETGLVHTTVDENTWVVSGYEDKLVPVLRGEEEASGGG